MKTILGLVLPLYLPASAFAQVILNGTLQEDADPPRAVTNTRVSVVGGPGVTTDSMGQFSIGLTRDFAGGGRVIIAVTRKDWVVNDPVDGEWNLPSIDEQNVQTRRVLIVPKGSLKLWSDARIQAYVTKLSEELARKQKKGSKPQPLSFEGYLTRWAGQFGFTVDQVREAFDRWAENAEASSSKRTKALSEVYRKNFEGAAKYFKEAALDRRKRREQRDKKETLAEYADWRDAGSSYFAVYRFSEALKQYQEAQNIINQRVFPVEWVELGLWIGRVKSRLAESAKGDTGYALLQDAKLACDDALKVYTVTEYPLEWAWAQRDLGVVLVAQAMRSEGLNAKQLLKQAATAMKQALEVFTQQEYPYEWAVAQDGLGTARRESGLRPSSSLALDEAIRAHRKALTVFTRTENPPEWAAAQANLAIALMERGLIAGEKVREDLLKQATSAIESSLEVFTQQDYPREWAMTQYNLGVALTGQGMRVTADQREILEEAITSYKNALKVYTQPDFPRQWADAQNGLRDATQLRCSRFRQLCSD